MLRRLVSSNTVEFKKPPVPEAPEPSESVEPSMPAVAGKRAATDAPARESGSGLLSATETAGDAAPNGDLTNGGGTADYGSVPNRRAIADDTYVKFTSDKHTELKMLIHQQLLDTMNLYRVFLSPLYHNLAWKYNFLNK